MSRYLLINPWIYDFAAYDFGTKPVGLLRIGEYLRRKGNEILLIDCLENCSRSKDRYGFSKIRKKNLEKPPIFKHIDRPYFRYGIPVDEFILRIKTIKNVDKIFISSGMTYWYPGVQFTIKLLRQHFKNTLILLGGIYATLCYEHAILKSGADVVWKGDYLEKYYFFEKDFYPAYDLLKDKEILPIQLTRGCPFRCSYCAVHTFATKFQMKNPINLFEEILYYRKTFGTKSFVFYDDALTFHSEQGIKKFLRMVIARGEQFTFHTPNGLHASFIDDELAELLKKANFKDLRISFETSDEKFQKITGGKVTNNDLKNAIRNLKEAGFSKNDIGIYILIGTQWLDIKRTISDIAFVTSLGVKAILASYSPIPGTRDYKTLISKNILRKDIDPLWHNKTVFAELIKPSYVEEVKRIRRLTSILNKA
jgi:radical SAM superfamily enzyme YgiQ (UPF0313 family)